MKTKFVPSIAPVLTKEQLLNYLEIKTTDPLAYNLKILCIVKVAGKVISYKEAVEMILKEEKKWIEQSIKKQEK